MSIIDTVNKYPDLKQIYNALSWSFMIDTLTPAQIVYLSQNPDKYDEWVHKCAQRIVNEINRSIVHAGRGDFIEWGIITKRTAGQTLYKAPAPDTSIHIPYQYKGVIICHQNTN